MNPLDLFLAVFLGLIAKDIVYAVFTIFVNGLQGIWRIISNKT
jgi:hypothetical protein